VRSESYRQTMQKGLDGRLQRATDKLLALTPPPTRGKRQIRDEWLIKFRPNHSPHHAGDIPHLFSTLQSDIYVAFGRKNRASG